MRTLYEHKTELNAFSKTYLYVHISETNRINTALLRAKLLVFVQFSSIWRILKKSKICL
jgi:hypothetical protein